MFHGAGTFGSIAGAAQQQAGQRRYLFLDPRFEGKIHVGPELGVPSHLLHDAGCNARCADARQSTAGEETTPLKGPGTISCQGHGLAFYLAEMQRSVVTALLLFRVWLVVM